MLSLVLRLHDPVAGSVTVDGHDLRDVSRESLLSQIAVVFQDNVLFNISLRENIGSAIRTRRMRRSRRRQAGGNRQIHPVPAARLRHHGR